MLRETVNKRSKIKRDPEWQVRFFFYDCREIVSYEAWKDVSVGRKGLFIFITYPTFTARHAVHLLKPLIRRSRQSR